MASITLRSLYIRFVPRSLRQALSPLLHLRRSLVQREALHYAAGAVISGPFEGMRFQSAPLSLPIVLGTYEIELHDIFQRLKGRPFSRIIDIGAAEGYYAVGAALWNANVSVTAFEANDGYHKSIRHLAESNNILDRIEIRGLCQISDLKAMGDALIGSFMIVDIEGFEKELLNPQEVTQLIHATILVEIHDNFVPGCGSSIRQRFQHSHNISSFTSRPRQLHEYPIKTGWSRLPFMRSACIDCSSDGRTEPNGWLLLEPKTVCALRPANF
jgi:hypothetical protein